MNTLSLNDLAFAYPGSDFGTPVTASLQTGNLVGILGANGSGKSTLLKGLAGLLPHRRGHARLNEKDWLDLSASERSVTMAYLEQNARCHWPLQVSRVVALGREAIGPTLSARSGIATDPAHLNALKQAMSITDIHALAHRTVTELSGGEQARVMLARALAAQTPILLADEPLSGLDPAHQLLVMERLQQWAREGHLVVLSLHDMNLALRFCDQALILGKGVCLAGPPADLLTPETLSACFGVEARRVEIDGVVSLVNWNVARD